MSNDDNGQYRLTAADVMELRESVRWRLADRSLGGPHDPPDAYNSTLPFVCYAREDRMAQNAPGYDPDAFVLHTQGHLRAISKRPAVLFACLREEWARPGFVVDMLDARTPPDEVLLNPSEQEQLRSRRLFEEKAAREFADEQRRAKAKAPAPKQPDPTTITVENLFDDDD